MFFILFLLFPFFISANDSITATSYILIEQDSFQIIAGKDYEKRLPPASTTKVMTTIVALENLKDDEIIRPDSKVASIPPSKLNLVPGRRYSSRELLKGTMIKSANDAAYALAVHIGGSEENFSLMMNDKAWEIGAFNTQFRNASGLPAQDQYTTCYDLALILMHALSNAQFKEIAATKYFFFQAGANKIRYKNHNRFLFCFEPAVVGKTGFTRASRHCYVGAFEKDGRVYILSLLGSNNLWGDAVNILKEIYQKVPTDKEIRMAKAHAVKLTSYKDTKKKKPTAKKSKKKKTTKAKKAKPNPRSKR